MNDITESVYRVFRAIVGDMAPPWENLPPETYVRWRRLADWLRTDMERMEGRPVLSVAEELYGVFMRDALVPLVWSEMPAEIKLGWEAVTRHLAMMLDDGAESMADAEAMWIDWAVKRLCATP